MADCVVDEITLLMVPWATPELEVVLKTDAVIAPAAEGTAEMTAEVV